MASGLFALLDDVAGIAKVAAASVDDIAANATKAGTKAAGVLIDDAAVTPKYVTGFDPARELPIIWRIARGSLVNKLVFLLPAALLLSAFAPWLIPILLICGGLYLCFEGAEKIGQVVGLIRHHGGDETEKTGDPAHLEEEKVKGAIKTDFILSAEIMVIALSVIETGGIFAQAATLAVVGVAVTFAVYGAVAIIVKLDDVGLWLGQNAMTGFGRAAGRSLVKFMPWLLKALAVIGTAAMLWVGGSIIVHSVAEMGWHLPEDTIKGIAKTLSTNPFAQWLVVATIDGILGLAMGMAIALGIDKTLHSGPKSPAH